MGRARFAEELACISSRFAAASKVFLVTATQLLRVRCGGPEVCLDEVRWSGEIGEGHIEQAPTAGSAERKPPHRG